jgi:DsbC/DsbD-like thiol-disulfide interchange protein
LDKARQTLQNFSGLIQKSPRGFINMTLAASEYLAIDSKTATSPSILKSEAVKAQNLTGLKSEKLVQAEASIISGKPIKGETVEIGVKLKVKSGWHINANPASMDYLIATSLQLPSEWLEAGAIKYPKAEKLSFAFADDPLAVYQNEVIISAKTKVKVDLPKDQDIALKLKYQACNDESCMPPETISVPLRLKK